MKRFGTALAMMGILAATTVGAGIFTLPWIFHSAGWGVALVLLVVLAALVAFGEYCYWRTLDAVAERERLVGLTRTHLGKEWGLLTLLGVAGGMFFTLTIYLILAERFLAILLPLPTRTALLLFWALAILPLTFNIRRFVTLEGAGTFLKCLLIIFVFFAAASPVAMLREPAVSTASPLLFFGAILFALGGWNAIEPMYEFWRGGKGKERGVKPLAVIAVGIASIAILYFLFAAGILGSLGAGSSVSPDTLSGLIGWPAWKVGALALLGLLALWTAYGPTALEVENVLRKDLRWNSTLSFALVALLPLAAVFTGLVSLVQAVTLAGAIFAGIQYVAIFVLARHILKPRPAAAWAMRGAAAIFAAAALYEVWFFMVH